MLISRMSVKIEEYLSLHSDSSNPFTSCRQRRKEMIFEYQMVSLNDWVGSLVHVPFCNSVRGDAVRSSIGRYRRMLWSNIPKYRPWWHNTQAIFYSSTSIRYLLKLRTTSHTKKWASIFASLRVDDERRILWIHLKTILLRLAVSIVRFTQAGLMLVDFLGWACKGRIHICWIDKFLLPLMMRDIPWGVNCRSMRHWDRKKPKHFMDIDLICQIMKLGDCLMFLGFRAASGFAP